MRQASPRFDTRCPVAPGTGGAWARRPAIFIGWSTAFRIGPIGRVGLAKWGRPAVCACSMTRPETTRSGSAAFTFEREPPWPGPGHSAGATPGRSASQPGRLPDRQSAVGPCGADQFAPALVLAATRAASSSRVEPMASAPRAAKRRAVSGSRAAAITAAPSRAAIASGRPAGAPTASQRAVSKPGRVSASRDLRRQRRALSAGDRHRAGAAVAHQGQRGRERVHHDLRPPGRQIAQRIGIAAVMHQLAACLQSPEQQLRR